ncbi:hypothetical protein M758_12G072700 [Ceratodon purpureus]|nr:hypothetical protein M758_12G072700 [Ceratodon purpureus]
MRRTTEWFSLMEGLETVAVKNIVKRYHYLKTRVTKPYCASIVTLVKQIYQFVRTVISSDNSITTAVSGWLKLVLLVMTHNSFENWGTQAMPRGLHKLCRGSICSVVAACHLRVFNRFLSLSLFRNVDIY